MFAWLAACSCGATQALPACTCGASIHKSNTCDENPLCCCCRSAGAADGWQVQPKGGRLQLRSGAVGARDGTTPCARPPPRGRYFLQHLLCQRFSGLCLLPAASCQAHPTGSAGGMPDALHAALTNQVCVCAMHESAPSGTAAAHCTRGHARLQPHLPHTARQLMMHARRPP